MNLRAITFPRRKYLIWFNKILESHGGDFDQKFYQKVKCPTYAQGPPVSGLTLIDALHGNEQEELRSYNHAFKI